MSIFKHTEANELLYYAIFGFFLASIPLLIRAKTSLNSASPEDSSFENLKTEPWKNYSIVLSFPIAIYFFGWLVGFQGISNAPLIVSSLLLIALCVLGFSKNSKKVFFSKISTTLLFLIFSMGAVFFNLTTFFFTREKASLSQPGGTWHHWGAFLSAAKSLAAGLAIYKEFPTQYGFGPSLFIATTSHYLGWVSGMFYAAGMMQFLYWCFITLIAFRIIKTAGARSHILIPVTLFMSFFACFFWTPGVEAFVNIYPSLGGARYFAISLFVAALFTLNLTTQNFSQKKVSIMYGFWAVGALWSIEFLFYVCLVWWPYYIYIHIPNNGNTSQILKSIFASVGRLLRFTVLFFLGVMLLYWIIYRTLPSFAVYSAFASNVPGALLINFKGPFIFAASLFLFAFGTLTVILKTRGMSDSFHYLFAITLMSYAAFSYYIGRSADQNIMPLAPFFSLILLSMCVPVFPRFVRSISISISTLSLIVCWVGVSQYQQGFYRDYLLDFRGSELGADFIKYWEDPATTDLGRAIEYITKNFNESAVAIDPTSSVTMGGNQEQWNAYNDINSYNILLPPLRKKVINLSKNRLHKAGWLLIHKDMGPQESFLELFTDSYDRKEEIPFGAYKAFRLVPKP